MRGLKRFVAFLSAVLMLLASSLPAGAESGTILDRVAAVETGIYGKVQPGSLVERLDRLELDLLGEVSKGSIVDRVNRVTAFAGPSLGEGPSLMYKLRAVEWAVFRSVEVEPLMVKLNRLEDQIMGVRGKGAITQRVEELVKACLPGGTLKTEVVTVPKGHPVRIRLVKEVSSERSKKGESVPFEVSQDVIVDGILVIPKGEDGQLIIADAVPAGRLGRDGKVELDVREVSGMDGTRVRLAMDEGAQKLNESLQLAVGASIAGFAILGPVGVLGGLLIQGKAVELPAGTEFYVSVRESTKVLGIPVAAGTGLGIQ